MDKIASPQALVAELQKLLTYARTPTPSRERLAYDLTALSDRLLGKTATRLVDTIGPGDRVTIVDRFGKEQTGRAVMKGPHGWVLNMGGKHGTPGIASDDNVTKVKKKKG
jgi:hypothetical protein